MRREATVIAPGSDNRPAAKPRCARNRNLLCFRVLPPGYDGTLKPHLGRHPDAAEAGLAPARRSPVPRCSDKKEGAHGGNPVSPVLIGVPRFELGTSPTRTERATRLRHTPGTPRLPNGSAGRAQRIRLFARSNGRGGKAATAS